MGATHARRIRSVAARAGTESFRLGAGDNTCTLRSAEEPSQGGADDDARSLRHDGLDWVPANVPAAQRRAEHRESNFDCFAHIPIVNGSASPSRHAIPLFRSIIGVAGYVALFAVLLFVPTGTLRWPAAWLLLAVLLVARGAGVILLHRTQPALLAERSRPPLQRGQVGIDRILLPASMASFAGIVAFASWDVWHRQLLGSPPEWLRTLGLLAFIAGWIVVHAALRANAFAVTVVRHQAERGHAVVTAGPYAIVRHPMYAGLMWLMLGLALWLGSTAAAVATVVPTAILALRIVVEENMLARSLSDYSAYTRRVRWRLLPGLW